MTLLLVLLTLHFIGDFLLQTDDMALNKSKSWRVLGLHAWTYVSVFFVAGLFYEVATATSVVRADVLVAFTLVTFAAHFAQDAVTSRLTTRLWFIDLYPRPDDEREPGDDRRHPRLFRRFGAYPLYACIIPGRRHWFFVAIGADQLLHAVQLGLTAQWLLV